ncbi:MAG: lipoprotein signal peptidase [Xanthomonadales bacterium]|nr:Lipoprotein signal peptidase [Xanthomonadales bacterium]MCC6594471.1 lipoprotein signal peptidase [Xanthomonadales bacterium]MCE7931905.1 lipoprotein signal peptidase [Xanthomonadales bacterium PRO6]
MVRGKSVAASEPRGRFNGWWWLPLSAIIIGLDQWTKALATGALVYGASEAFLPHWNWTLVHNYGGAFSFLSNHPGWQRWFFLIVASGITLALLEWLRRCPPRAWLPCLPLALLIGGAIGNLIDRIQLGYVVDFVDWHYDGWHWPAFNLADSAITVGIVLLIVYEVFGTREAGPGTRKS